MTNKKSIFPLQPIGGPPKSGITPMSGKTAAPEVEEPELPFAEPLPVELLEVEVLDELLDDVLASPELESAGRVATSGVVKPVVDTPGSLQAASATNARARRGGAIAAESSAKLRRGQARGAGPSLMRWTRAGRPRRSPTGCGPVSVPNVIDVSDHAAVFLANDQVKPPAAGLLVAGREQELNEPAILVDRRLDHIEPSYVPVRHRDYGATDLAEHARQPASRRQTRVVVEAVELIVGDVLHALTDEGDDGVVHWRFFGMVVGVEGVTTML